ncbi:PEPxxWA-CTERM sorting domain-containing protein [Polymorphobacter sp. PAMC 29334]|nr:PEPxxWA-CTERM sorting domain-containing protein [Polymorphobacter sp. PAMC 29334]
MTMNSLFRALVVGSALTSAVPALAVMGVHVESGEPGFISFDIAELPNPASFISGSYLTLNNVKGVFNGIAGKRTIDFFNNSLGGGFQVVGGPGITSQQIFIRDESAPLVLTGDYSAQDRATGAGAGLIIYENGEIAAVPEPATWALMIGGFGLVGMTVRRRAAIAC